MSKLKKELTRNPWDSLELYSSEWSKLKKEKGSITVIVTVTVLFFITILSTAYAITASIRQSQLKSQLSVKETYEADLENVSQIIKKIPQLYNEVPNKAEITLSTNTTNTTTAITATVLQSDNQSGVDITKCKWVYNATETEIGTDEASYTGGTFTSNPETLSLIATTQGTYYLHVLTTDNAGNVRETVSEAITVNQLVTGVTLSQTSTTLKVGGTTTLTATIAPTNASNQNVNWSSSNTSVATVSSGKITAKAVGSATITATAADGSGNKATCTITVIAADEIILGGTVHSGWTLSGWQWEYYSTYWQLYGEAANCGTSLSAVSTATYNFSNYKYLSFNYWTWSTGNSTITVYIKSSSSSSWTSVGSVTKSASDEGSDSQVINLSSYSGNYYIKFVCSQSSTKQTNISNVKLYN